MPPQFFQFFLDGGGGGGAGPGGTEDSPVAVGAGALVQTSGVSIGAPPIGGQIIVGGPGPFGAGVGV